jgi:hypothetical protein
VERLDLSEEDVKVSMARLEERIRAAADALNVAQSELHRRLEMLNGEAARLREMQATYIPRETYDRGIEAIEKATRSTEIEVDRRLKLLENQSANDKGKQWVGGAIVLILAAAIATATSLVAR